MTVNSIIPFMFQNHTIFINYSWEMTTYQQCQKLTRRRKRYQIVLLYDNPCTLLTLLRHCHLSWIIKEHCVILKNKQYNWIGRHLISLHTKFYYCTNNPCTLLVLFAHCDLSWIINKDCVILKNKRYNWIGRRLISLHTQFYYCTTNPCTLFALLTHCHLS